jgi:Zn-finger nucleic acid-binding protein
MKCPACKEVNLVMSERQGVEIDYCPDCRGVWLDRGELDKIIEKSAAAEVAAPMRTEIRDDRSGRDRDDREYDRKPHKRRKSFFEEIFD